MAQYLSQVPFDAQLLLALDVGRLRNQPIWKVLLASLTQDPNHSLAGFIAGAGFDPTKQVSRALLAMPGERQADESLEKPASFALIAETNQVDEGRAMTWMRREMKTAVFAPDHHRFFVGNGAWAEPMAGLAHATKLAQSAADNPEIRRLCDRVGKDHTLWFAAIVPASIRRSLIANTRFPDTASITRLAGFVDFEAGLHAEATADLSNKDDAIHLAHRLSTYLNQAKQHPEMLVQGFAPYLEALRLKTFDASVQVRLDLTAAHLTELASHIEALAHTTWTK